MKTNFKKFAALALALLMCVSTIVPAFAATTCPAVHTVDNCEYTVVSEKAATCEADGIATYACKACNKEFVVVTPKSGAHDYKESVIAATCTTAGTITKVCSLCGDTKTETVQALGHTYVYEWAEDSATKDACVAGSKWTKRTCSVCGDEKTVAAGEAIADGHEWKIVEITKAPTCKTTGLATYACADCGKKLENAEVAKIVHASGVEVKTIAVVSPATCTADAIERYQCAECGVVEAKVEGTKGHGQNGFTALTAAAKTCTTAEIPEGAKTCKDCSALCKADGTAYTENELKALAAACTKFYTNTTDDTKQKTDADGWIVKTAAACGVAGSKYRTCVDCGKVEEKAITALEHVKGTLHDTEATCLTAGEYYYECANEGCEEKLEYVSTPATGHDMETDKTWVRTDAEELEGLDPDEDVVCGEQYYITTSCKNCADVTTTKTAKFDDHKFETKSYDATCSVYAYSVDVCACGEVFVNVEDTEGYDATKQKTDENGKYNVGTAYDADAHVYLDADGNYDLKEENVVGTAKQTCLDAGKYIVYCRECNGAEKVVDVPALGHLYPELPEDFVAIPGVTVTVEGNDTHNGQAGWVINVPGIDKWDIALRKNTGTCLVASVYGMNCKRGCGKGARTISPDDGTGKGHVKSEVGYIPATDATCTVGAKTEGWSCKNAWCDYTVASTVGETLHVRANMIKTDAVLSTCTTDGNYEYYTCKLGADCAAYNATTGLAYTLIGATGDTTATAKADLVEKLNKGHNTVAGTLVSRTGCLDFQYQTAVCTKCDDYITVSNFQKALGHNWAIEATSVIKNCEAGTFATYECLACDAVDTVKLGDAGHKNAAGQDLTTGCANDYVNDRKCAECGLIIEKDAHKFGDWTVDGVVAKRSCSVCGEAEKVQHVVHTWDDGVKGDDAIVYSCFCGATKSEAIEAPVVDEPADDKPVEEPKKGCKGSVSVMGLALVAAIGTCAVVVSKKKED